tara:strand:+ start:708 stop:1598 length:891 start_codon:yes stop_codon:yes gene_type:complete
VKIFNLKKRVSIKELQKILNLKFVSKKDQYISSLSSYQRQGNENLGFIDSDRLKNIKKSEVKSSCVIITKKIDAIKNFIIYKNPRKLFEKISIELIKNYSKNDEFLSPKELLKYNVGSNVLISKHAKVDTKVKIESNVVIHKNTRIEKNTLISSGSVIGSVGLGPYFSGGIYKNCTHLGGVHIKKNCFIGSNSIIVRGTLGDTVIGDNSFISNLVNIGHNVQIGKTCFISSGVVIGGSTVINSLVKIGIGAVINRNIKIGTNVSIGLGSCVRKNIEKNKTVAGNPLRVIDLKKKMF